MRPVPSLTLPTAVSNGGATTLTPPSFDIRPAAAMARIWRGIGVVIGGLRLRRYTLSGSRRRFLCFFRVLGVLWWWECQKGPPTASRALNVFVDFLQCVFNFWIVARFAPRRGVTMKSAIFKTVQTTESKCAKCRHDRDNDVLTVFHHPLSPFDSRITFHGETVELEDFEFVFDLLAAPLGLPFTAGEIFLE